jgi:hypothetical protein
VGFGTDLLQVDMMWFFLSVFLHYRFFQSIPGRCPRRLPIGIVLFSAEKIDLSFRLCGRRVFGVNLSPRPHNFYTPLAH